MDQNNSDNSANHDLEQQLLNVLEFVTSPLKSDVKFPDLDDNSQAVKKAFTTLKKVIPVGAKWLRLAAMSGDLKAQFFLGLLFMKGQGVPPSPFHAAAWLSLASSQGHKGRANPDGCQALSHTKRFRDAQCYAATLYEQIHQLQHSI